MKREILMLFSYYGVGGAQRRAITIAKELVKRGLKVTIVAVLGENGSIQGDFYGLEGKIEVIDVPKAYQTYKTSKQCRRYESAKEIELKCLKRIQSVLSSETKLYKKINDRVRGIKNARELRAILNCHKGAELIVFGFNIFERCYFAHKGLNQRIIYAETNAQSKFIHDRNYKATLRLVKRADAWIFQTEDEKLSMGLGDESRAVVIRNPIKEDLPSPFEGTRRNVIVNFCAFKEHKNLLLLVKSFEKLLALYPQYQLYIYGDAPEQKESRYRDEIVRYISDNGLSRSVMIMPADPKVHELVRDAAMFVSSSDYEGLSNSMIEAMAIGLPCVCTDCEGGGAREMITDGVNGLLVPCRDEEALFNGMRRMIEDISFAEECGKNAAKIKEELKAEEITKKWTAVIKR